jgi:CRP-like cAMP-binding protein
MGAGDIKDTPLFRDIPEDILDVLIPLVNEESFKGGGEIFHEGSSSDRFFIIKSGEVEIRKGIDTGEEGRYKLIAVLQGGEFFGEMAVFLDKPRSATAVAKTDVSVVSIKREDLLDMFGRSPEAAFKVMGFLTSVLMDRLRNTTKEMVTVYETGRLVTAARSIKELSDYVLESVLSAVEGAEAGLFVLWNEFNEEYDIFGQRGVDDISTPMAMPEDDPVLGLLNETREPIVSFDLGADTRLSIPEDSLYGGKSLVAAPFMLQDRMLGFMLLINRGEPDAFSYNHMVLLSAISGYVSVAVENLRYVQAEVDRARLDQGKSTITPF